MLAAAEVGANVTLIVQDVDAANDEPHVVADREKPVPVTEVLRPAREVVLLFVIVTIAAGLAVFVAWLP